MLDSVRLSCGWHTDTVSNVNQKRLKVKSCYGMFDRQYWSVILMDGPLRKQLYFFKKHDLLYIADGVNTVVSTDKCKH